VEQALRDHKGRRVDQDRQDFKAPLAEQVLLDLVE
jgi:hypothetical protein